MSVFRSALLAAAFAAICVAGEVLGCIVVLGLGMIALIVVDRDQADRGEASRLPILRQFIPWAVCILLYAGFVLLWSPLASLPAVIIALLLLSPLFGTLVFVSSSAVASLTRRYS